MANTSYLKYVVEPFIAKWVSQKIGLELRPRRVAIGKNMEGKWVHFSFDGVSEDGNVGLLISSSQTVKPGGTRKLHVDASILLQAPFKRRIMAFLDRNVRMNFVNKCDGLLSLCEIEMFVCSDIPCDMMHQIQLIQSDAKSEVGDKGRVWTPGGKRN